MNIPLSMRSVQYSIYGYTIDNTHVHSAEVSTLVLFISKPIIIITYIEVGIAYLLVT